MGVIKKYIIKHISSDSKQKMKSLKYRLGAKITNLKYKTEAVLKKSPFSEDFKVAKKMIIFGTPTHGNLGDLAIVKAEIDFLSIHFPEYKIFEIPTEDIFPLIHHFKKIISSNDILFYHGGGNIGNLYLKEEIPRRYVFKILKGKKIIHFPQSAAFTLAKPAIKEELISQKIYASKGKELTIIGRENKSYKKFQEIFHKNNILYTPDIVLTVDERKDVKRKGVLLCMRSDSEKILSNENQDLMIKALREKYDDVLVTDTTVDYAVTKEIRDAELEKKWDEYRQAKVVITDRLHGMVFAVLTGTPCIVFDNYNSKVKLTYQDWLSDYQNIKFIDVLQEFSVPNILATIDEIADGEVPPFIQGEKYAPLLKEIQNQISD